MDGSGVTLIVPFVSRLLVFHLRPLLRAGKVTWLNAPESCPSNNWNDSPGCGWKPSKSSTSRSPARTNCPVTLIWSYWLPAMGPANCITVLVELPKIGVAAESDFDGIAGAEVALNENVAAAREAAAAGEGPQENRAAVRAAHRADDQRSVLGHVTVEGHPGTAGDGDVAARACS